MQIRGSKLAAGECALLLLMAAFKQYQEYCSSSPAPALYACRPVANDCAAAGRLTVLCSQALRSWFCWPLT